MAGKIREYEAVDFGEGLKHCPDPGIVYQEDTSVSIEYSDDYWNNYLKYEHSAISEALNKFRTGIAQKYCECVLDCGIGCGTFIKNLSIPSYGFDINPIGVAWLKERRIYCNPYENIPDAVNGVTMFDVIEHLPNPDELLTKLPVGMYLITSIPIFNDLNDIWTSKHLKKNEHYTYWSERGLKTYMSDIGFQSLEVRDDETKIGRDSIKTFVFERVS